MKMCDALAEMGHNVTLFATRGDKSSINLHKIYDCKKNFEIITFKSRPSKIDKILSKAKKSWNKTNKSSDLIYARDIYSGLISSITYGKPLALELHAPISSPKLFLLALKLCQYRSKKVKLIVISDALKLIIQNSINIPASMISVHHDGANEFDNSVPSTPVEDNTISYIGSTYQGRGIELIFEIAKKLEHLQFHIVGGPESEYKIISNANPPPKNIIYFGHQDQVFVKNKLKSSFALLAPYQKSVRLENGKGDTSQWMSPLKIFEYMSSGRPLIASNLPILQEVLENNKNSLLCNPESPSEWIEAINKLKTNIELREKISSNAAVELKEKYSWKVRVKKILDYF